MKPEERIAKEFLEKTFNTTSTYEPLGKSSPPDFAIDGTAFEVRRLNQRFFHHGGTNEGLEQVDIRLSHALSRALSRIPFSEQGGSIYWGLKFGRPLLDKIGKTVNQLAKEAQKYYQEGSRKPKEITANGVALDLLPATASTGKAFMMGYTVDDDSGGMLGDIYPTSIRLALEDKLEKTKSIVAKFDRWILILVDDVLPARDWVTSATDSAITFE